MMPSNVDPRRPDKVQRYKPPSTNGNASGGEDLTPDYMNILGELCLHFDWQMIVYVRVESLFLLVAVIGTVE